MTTEKKITRRNLNKAISEFRGESDRAAVIVASAQIDVLLKEAIQKSLLPQLNKERDGDELLEHDRPLATFSARTKVAFRLGLIDEETLKLIDIIRKIRNDFAHDVGIRLSDVNYRNKMNGLITPFRKSFEYAKQDAPNIIKDGARGQFEYLAALTIMLLYSVVKKTEQVKPLRKPYGRIGLLKDDL